MRRRTRSSQCKRNQPEQWIETRPDRGRCLKARFRLKRRFGFIFIVILDGYDGVARKSVTERSLTFLHLIGAIKFASADQCDLDRHISSLTAARFTASGVFPSEPLSGLFQTHFRDSGL